MAKAAYDEKTIKILANPRRRMFLQALASSDVPTSLNALVTEVMSLEDGDWEDCSKYRNSVRVSLRQNHLDVLEANGIIKYDNETDLVELGDEFHKISGMLDIDDEESTTHYEMSGDLPPRKTDVTTTSPTDQSSSLYSDPLLILAFTIVLSLLLLIIYLVI